MENDYHAFMERIRAYGYVSEAAEKDLLSRVSLMHWEKGIGLSEKDRWQQVCLSLKGYGALILSKGITEITIWFAYEGQIAVSISSLFYGKPSHETVECVEDCDLFCISNKDLQELYARYECMNTIGRRMAEEYCSILDDRVYSFQVMSATERYKDLMEFEPEIIKRAPLSNIASYLGISQETLSRIRHNW